MFSLSQLFSDTEIRNMGACDENEMRTSPQPISHNLFFLHGLTRKRKTLFKVEDKARTDLELISILNKLLVVKPAQCCYNNIIVPQQS